MKKKPRASAKRTKRATPKARRVHNLSPATRGEDQRLRDALEDADLDAFDAIIGKAIRRS